MLAASARARHAHGVDLRDGPEPDSCRGRRCRHPAHDALTLATRALAHTADDVTTHRLDGAGVYVFNQNNPTILTANGFTVPETPGVQLHHIMTVNLSAGTIEHVVNGVGDPADTDHIGVPSYIVDYPTP